MTVPYGTMSVDLETWLPQQIAAVAEDQRWCASWNTPEARERWPHVSPVPDADPAMVNQCVAHVVLLRRHHLVHDEEFGGLYCRGCGFNVLGEPCTRRSLDHCPTWRAVALAYQHRPGYREEWRPFSGAEANR